MIFHIWWIDELIYKSYQIKEQCALYTVDDFPRISENLRLSLILFYALCYSNNASERFHGIEIQE